MIHLLFDKELTFNKLVEVPFPNPETSDGRLIVCLYNQAYRFYLQTETRWVDAGNWEEGHKGCETTKWCFYDQITQTSIELNDFVQMKISESAYKDIHWCNVATKLV